jgi:hypothetical protein
MRQDAEFRFYEGRSDRRERTGPALSQGGGGAGDVRWRDGWPFGPNHHMPRNHIRAVPPAQVTLKAAIAWTHRTASQPLRWSIQSEPFPVETLRYDNDGQVDSSSVTMWTRSNKRPGPHTPVALPCGLEATNAIVDGLRCVLVSIAIGASSAKRAMNHYDRTRQMATHHQAESESKPIRLADKIRSRPCAMMVWRRLAGTFKLARDSSGRAWR